MHSSAMIQFKRLICIVLLVLLIKAANSVMFSPNRLWGDLGLTRTKIIDTNSKLYLALVCNI